MSEITSAIVSKVWGMCNPLRDDGVSYGDYGQKKIRTDAGADLS